MNLKNKHHSLTTYIILTIAGILGLVFSILWLPRSNYQHGLIYGVTSGFILTGIAGIIYSVYLKRNPKKAKEANIQKDEERTQFIRMKTAVSTSQVVLYIECLAILVIGLMGYKDISMVLVSLLTVQAIVATIFANYYSKKY